MVCCVRVCPLNSNDVTPLQFRQPPAFSTNSLNVVDPELSNPRIHQYSVSYQREIGWKNVLEINYIGRQGRDLYRRLRRQSGRHSRQRISFGVRTVGTTGNSTVINNLLAGHSGLTLVSGVRETGSQFLLRQSLAGPVRLANGTTTTNLVAAGAVAQAAFIIAQSTQGSFAAGWMIADRERLQSVFLRRIRSSPAP